MLSRGSSDQRIVDGTAGDSQSTKLGAEVRRLRLAEESGCREVLGEEAIASGGDRRSPAGNRVRTEYVSNQA